MADRAITDALGWRPGDRLTLTAAAGVVIVRRDPDGMVTMPAKPYVAIRATRRHRCEPRPGDRVLFPGAIADLATFTAKAPAFWNKFGPLR